MGRRSLGELRLSRLIAAPLVVIAWFAAASAGNEPTPSETDDRISALETALEQLQGDQGVARGQRVFARTCATCHGPDGRGDGPAAADLDPSPRDLSTRQYRFRTTPSGEAPTAQDLERTIRRGLPGTSMPAFGDLFSTAEMADLVRFIRSLQPSRPDDAGPTPLVDSVSAAGPGTLEQGHAIYLVSGCWRCHAVNGSGRGPSARGLTDEDDMPIRTTDFRYDPFKGGRDPESIVRTLLTGLNGAPMPSYGDAMLFAREDVEDTSTLDSVIPEAAHARLDEHLRSVPSRAELEKLGPQGRIDLRDRRLAALAHYILSLDRRAGFRYWLLRERPEQEARGR